MSKAIREHVRSNVIGYLALFVALSGTAYAVDGPLPGQNQVGSADIINDEVYSADVRNDNLSGGGLAAADLGANSVGSSEIGTGGVNTSEIANSAIGADEIGDGLHVHTGTPVSVPGGGAPQNGSYDTGVASANCASGEELISANAEWEGAFPQDGELWTAEVHVNHSTEGADVIGGNDSGTARNLVAVVTCLGA
jgi:hypothetical protein